MTTQMRGKWYLVIIMMIMITGFTNIKNVNSAQNRLSGRILLQVEQNGEAWYVNPKNQRRYFLGRPADAFALMRELGLGVSEVNYKKFEANNNQAPSSLSGKILLRVENNGEAYYVNPLDLKMHYLGRPADAFGVMRNLGLGITDKDLGNIDVEKGVEKVVSEVVKPVEEKNDSQNSNTIVSHEAKTYVGSGTYDFVKGDVLIDNVNNMKFVCNGLYEEGSLQWIMFDIFDNQTGQKVSDFMMFLDPDKLYTGDERMRKIYRYISEPAKLPTYFMQFKGRNSDGSHKFTFEFYLDDVLGDTAVGNKKILIVPVYFDDEYEVYDQYPIYRDNFLKPALTEIQAYLRVKQIEFMGEEIMTVNFTVSDAVKLVGSKKYFLSDEGDGFDERKAIVDEKTKYSFDNFDDVVYMFFTEKNLGTNYLNTALYNQAMITMHMSPITDYELNTPIQIHQKRNTITNGLLHEILHIFGMSDINGGGKYDFYSAVLFDGNQLLDEKFKTTIDTISENSQTGIFQKIDNLVSYELGWCDENNNEIWDANEFYENINEYK